MIVLVSRRAQRDLDEIFDDLMVRASDDVALRMVDLIERRALSLRDFPRRGGRLLPHLLQNLRYISERPYLIVYRISPTTVEIVAVVHGARDVGALLSDFER